MIALAVAADGATPKAKKASTPRRAVSAETKKPEAAAPSLLADGSPNIRAASAVVLDAKTGRVLWQKNALQHRPPASTQKLLTALIIAESGGLETPVKVTASDTWAEPSKLYIQPGDTYPRIDLLRILLVKSMNDVARCLARDNAGSLEVFAEKMNRRMTALGAQDSHFVNPNGLPVPGQFSCAQDMARVALAAYYNRTIRAIVAMKSLTFRYADGRTRDFKNTNRVLQSYSLCNGMKTGYTEAAGHCLISSASDGTHDVIAVTLGGSKEAIWKDSYTLLTWGLAHVE